jgi:hypothetical protein
MNTFKDFLIKLSSFLKRAGMMVTARFPDFPKVLFKSFVIGCFKTGKKGIIYFEVILKQCFQPFCSLHPLELKKFDGTLTWLKMTTCGTLSSKTRKRQ